MSVSVRDESPAPGVSDGARPRPEISVVVPVYGVEAYLPRCLESLAAQSIVDDLEILLVDDGSPDGCGALCDRFAAAHANARALHKENGGVSSARNAGLAAATGTYVAFVDGDDFLRADALEIARDALDAGADAVFFRYAVTHDDAENALADAPAPVVLEGAEVMRALLEHREGVLENVFKVFRRSVIGGARFPEEYTCGEDSVFLFRACAGVRRAVVPAQHVYFYRVRPGSIMRTLRPEVLDQRVAAHAEAARLARETWPELAHTARGREMYMRLFVLNEMLDAPETGDAACFRRHVRGLRRDLPALLRTRCRRWLPPRRKVYALMLALCPGLTRRVHARRAQKRREASQP